MPMSKEENLEKVQRLHTAHRKTKEFLENEPLSWELHPGTDIARNWTVLTAAYSGLEQKIQYLIAEEQGLHIAKLIEPRQNGRNPYRTHDVSELFTKLEKPTQEAIGEFYARFQSLHSYIAIETVDAFLRAVAGPQGDGYGRWRYALRSEQVDSAMIGKQRVTPWWASDGTVDLRRVGARFEEAPDTARGLPREDGRA